MKKSILFFLAALCFITGCIRYHADYRDGGRTSVRVKESTDYYELDAKFSKRKMRKVLHVLEAKIGEEGGWRGNDGGHTVTLDDGTKFYLKTAPGRIKLRLDRDENDPESLLRVRHLGDDIKAAITQ